MFDRDRRGLTEGRRFRANEAHRRGMSLALTRHKEGGSLALTGRTWGERKFGAGRAHGGGGGVGANEAHGGRGSALTRRNGGGLGR